LNGNFYGTTNGGGAGGGTIFEITPGGQLTTLYSFCSQSGCTDGSTPEAGLVQATNGNFYGTTSDGGANGGSGTVFEITRQANSPRFIAFAPNRAASTAKNLKQRRYRPRTATSMATTSTGGTGSYGTVFSLATGLGPFIETLPTSGKVGAAVKILGNNLTGATSVTFNGTAATFTVVSSTEITTTVPSSATTGKITVTTPSTTLTSNVNFRVTPTIASFLPTSGPVGTSIVITGVSLTGATSVTIGGVKAASFTVDSDTQITATVPSGAKTGKVGVTTSGGKTTSAGTFTVTT
jgi:uncharacterized repeat protein (TIGR03803 family)